MKQCRLPGTRRPHDRNIFPGLDVLIDIPYGNSAKVTKKQARHLRKKFLYLGRKFGIKIEVVLTDGSQPIGKGIGPILEMMDVLKVLRRENPPKDLESKSIFLASKILEMVGKAKKGKGKELAMAILNSGEAYKKFEDIISAQGRTHFVFSKAKLSHTIKSGQNGRIISIDNKKINRLATILGCPLDKGAGIYLYKHKNERIRKGESILTLYSDSKLKLDESLSFFSKNPPVVIKK